MPVSKMYCALPHAFCDGYLIFPCFFMSKNILNLEVFDLKRIIAFFLIIILIPLMALSGCTQAAKSESERISFKDNLSNHNDTTPSQSNRISIVCTIFPLYDWVRQILGSKTDVIELTLLLNNRIDLHNYQPSVDDFVKISACDLFIYVGGESDKWVDDALKDSINPNMATLNLLDVLGDSVKAEELVEGMEEENDNESTSNDSHSNRSSDNDTTDQNMKETYEDVRDYDNDNDSDNEAEYDEHVWLSLRNARIFCSAIADALSALDSANVGEYRSNASSYVDKLLTLDASYQTLINACPVKTMLFGDRFPFRYLADDYGISYYAAFPGCSAETEASFETIIFLAGKADELNLKSIMVTESADQTIANTIISNTKIKQQQIFVLDAMQSVTASDLTNGTTYLSIMESNLDVLKEALN